MVQLDALKKRLFFVVIRSIIKVKFTYHLRVALFQSKDNYFLCIAHTRTWDTLYDFSQMKYVSIS